MAFGKEKNYVRSSSNQHYKFEIGQEVIGIDPIYLRPTEVASLIGDPSKAKNNLGWKPKYDLQVIVKEMVEHDIKNLEDGSSKSSRLG
jgi:GDPmannose 4,6-dehydratase